MTEKKKSERTLTPFGEALAYLIGAQVAREILADWRLKEMYRRLQSKPKNPKK